MLRYVMLGLAIILSTSPLKAKVTKVYARGVSYRATAGLTESEKVERLIQFIRSLKDATFVRNGSEHSCEQAAEHLQSKWEKHRNKIQSARAFIEDLASKSGLSGEPYMIRFKDGTEHTTNAVLNRELKRLEAM